MGHLHPRTPLSTEQQLKCREHQLTAALDRCTDIAANSERYQSPPVGASKDRVRFWSSLKDLESKTRDTPRRLALMAPLNRNTDAMTKGSNAGVKRNRRPTGIKPVERKIRLDPDTAAALAAACEASGQLSMSLYLERLIGQLSTDLGALPVLSPTLDGTEVHTKRAA